MHLVKSPQEVFGKVRQDLEGDGMSLLTFEWTNQISYCEFSQVATAGSLLLAACYRPVASCYAMWCLTLAKASWNQTEIIFSSLAAVFVWSSF